MSVAPTRRPTKIADGRVDPPVSVHATLVRNVLPSDVEAIESVWMPARRILVAASEADGSHLENSHCDWVRKAPQAEDGSLALYAVECESEVQGLMAISTRPREAILTEGSSLVYVEYIEAAPWNIRTKGHLPRFLGIGTALIADAVRISLEMGLGGRVGLHSLSQAERFYEQRCRMTCLGPDEDYYRLVYFEYPEGVSSSWLTAMGFEP